MNSKNLIPMGLLLLYVSLEIDCRIQYQGMKMLEGCCGKKFVDDEGTGATSRTQLHPTNVIVLGFATLMRRSCDQTAKALCPHAPFHSLLSYLASLA